MENYDGKKIEGVYACYGVTPQTAKVLSVLSADIQHIMKEIPEHHKPEVKAPHSYHVTLDYAGEVADILSYVEDKRAVL